jgi:hypothetical protein
MEVVGVVAGNAAGALSEIPILLSAAFLAREVFKFPEHFRSRDLEQRPRIGARSIDHVAAQPPGGSLDVFQLELPGNSKASTTRGGREWSVAAQTAGC